jgi:pimeloyl-ACP methyl ester carboxylesterase
MKKAKKIIGSILLLIVTIILIFFIFLFIKSPGKLDSLANATGETIANSIAEKEIIEIGGIKQGFFIRSENPDNPVILFLHGGPGSPELPTIIRNESKGRLEKYFTICWWEQRGSGLSYHDDLDKSKMTIEQMIEDTREMTEYLRKRFGKNKIYILGHSWGTYLGVKTIEKYPELYSAYIGVGQLTDQNESERDAYDYMLKYAEQTNDVDAIAKLKKYNKNAPDFPQVDYMRTVRWELLNKYGIGMTREGVSKMDIAKDLLLFKGYTIPEKINYVKGLDFSFRYVQADYFMDFSKPIEIPVYIIQGKYDYQTSYEAAKKYFENIAAPKKEFITFEDSAHSPQLEEPERFIQVVQDIVAQNP